jgi:hypothetical protein
MKVTVNVKWNKEIYKDVEVDLDEPPESFKIQIMSLTGVPIERQKVLGKGGMLQNDAWGKVTVKEGMTVMVMGTADEAMIPAKVEAPQFVEDLPEQVLLQRDLMLRVQLPRHASGSQTTTATHTRVVCAGTRNGGNAPVWRRFRESGQYLLHECLPAVFVSCSRAAGSTECSSRCHIVLSPHPGGQQGLCTDVQGSDSYTWDVLERSASGSASV